MTGGIKPNSQYKGAHLVHCMLLSLDFRKSVLSLSSEITIALLMLYKLEKHVCS